ncbi:MAG: hypothetical protein IKE01_06785 [Clostridia bacterium]|nr:hypothetical protein [Clostridia bacterium]
MSNKGFIKMDNMERKYFILFKRSLWEIAVYAAVISAVMYVKVTRFGLDTLHKGGLTMAVLFVTFTLCYGILCAMTRDKRQPTWAIALAWIMKFIIVAVHVISIFFEC